MGSCREDDVLLGVNAARYANRKDAQEEKSCDHLHALMLIKTTTHLPQLPRALPAAPLSGEPSNGAFSELAELAGSP